MRYYLDTEFIEDGKTIDLISIGIVSDDNRQFYAANLECDWTKADDWVKKNVLSGLPLITTPPTSPYYTRTEIKLNLLTFLHGDRNISFWGYYCDYDWVAFCQLFGRMVDLPEHFPKLCNDLKQLCNSLGNPKLPKQWTKEHNALNDASWNKDVHNFLIAHANKRKNDKLYEYKQGLISIENMMNWHNP